MNTHTKTLTGILTGTVLAFALTSSPSQAQTAHYLSQNASRCEIFRGLSHDLPPECGRTTAEAQFTSLRSLGRTRGLVVYGDTQPVRVANADTAAAQTSPATSARETLSIAFRAEFKFDSYELTPEAKKVIDKVAGVLKDKLMRDKVIEIEGHTDARGDNAYNMVLSEKRAIAVTEYLVTRHQIDPSHLKSVGRGKTELYDPAHPDAGINRRVEFKNISG